MQTIIRIGPRLGYRRPIALAAGWLCGGIACAVLAMLLPVFNEFLASVPVEVAYVEVAKLMLVAAVLRFIGASVTAPESLFLGFGLAVSWPFAGVLSPAVTAGLALVHLHGDTAYFVALNMAFLLTQVAAVLAWIFLRTP